MLNITINNKKHTVDVPEDMPILYVLRDELSLLGTKFGCGLGQCGACTIHIDGHAMRSCITPISYAANKSITTIEGLDDEANHRVQIAWREFKVPQCGYCQVGQMMSASAMLDNIPNPTDEEIDLHMQGNVCRCGTYDRIRKAIKHAAQLPANK